jgi:hypothetical protein
LAFPQGVVDPCIQALWARWAPKNEKAQLTTCSYTGLSIAGILTFYISGQLCGIHVDNGWPFIFYFFGQFTPVLSQVVIYNIVSHYFSDLTMLLFCAM